MCPCLKKFSAGKLGKNIHQQFSWISNLIPSYVGYPNSNPVLPVIRPDIKKKKNS